MQCCCFSSGCVEIAPIPDVNTGSTASTPNTPVIDLPSGSLFSDSQSHTVPSIVDGSYLRTAEGIQMVTLLLQSSNYARPSHLLEWLREFGEFLEWDVGKDLIGCKYCRQANSAAALATGKPVSVVSRHDIASHEFTNTHRLVMQAFRDRGGSLAPGDVIGHDNSGGGGLTSLTLCYNPSREYGQQAQQQQQQQQHVPLPSTVTSPVMNGGMPLPVSDVPLPHLITYEVIGTINDPSLLKDWCHSWPTGLVS